MKTTKHFFALFFFTLLSVMQFAFAQEPRMSLPPPDPAKGTIGLKIDNMRDAYITQFKLKPGQAGMIVIEAIAGSSGQKAGFKAGDLVTAINGKKVNNTREFMDERLKFKVGDMLQISGVSAGKPYIRKVKIMPVG